MLLISFRLNHSFLTQRHGRPQYYIRGLYPQCSSQFISHTQQFVSAIQACSYSLDSVFLFVTFWYWLPAPLVVLSLSFRGRPRGIVPGFRAGVLWTICVSKWLLLHDQHLADREKAADPWTQHRRTWQNSVRIESDVCLLRRRETSSAKWCVLCRIIKMMSLFVIKIYLPWKMY